MRKTVVRLAATAGAFAVTGVAATVLKNSLTERRRNQREDIEPFGTVRGESRQVIADDGVAITIDIDEGPAPTVVFVHGWMCDGDVWHFQRLSMRGQARIVVMDLRSHGRSGRAMVDRCTIDDLADDLSRVIDDAVLDGPIVLVGHSMGGMAIMHLASVRPELFGDRVVGAVLVATSAGGLRRASPALRRIGPVVRALSPVLDWGREFNSYSVIKRWGVGPNASATAIDLTNELLLRAPSQVIVDFYPLIAGLDIRAGLAPLAKIRTSVVCGTRDLMTPLSQSRKLARLIDAELVSVTDAGHMVMFEEPEQITEVIERVIKDVT